MSLQLSVGNQIRPSVSHMFMKRCRRFSESGPDSAVAPGLHRDDYIIAASGGVCQKAPLLHFATAKALSLCKTPLNGLRAEEKEALS